MTELTFSDAERRHIQSDFDLTDDELDVFMSAAVRYGLNPLQRQIYARIQSNRGSRKLMFMTGIDGYRLVADRTGKYAGNDDPVFDNEDTPRKATVTVYKMVEGVRCPFPASARWDQYFPGEKIGFMWKRMPHLMLGKCAEALALRKAFPQELAGIYTDAEMEQADGSSQAPEKSKAPAQRVAPEPPKEDTPRSLFIAKVTEWTGDTKMEDIVLKCKTILEGLSIPSDGKASDAEFGHATDWVAQRISDRDDFDSLFGKEEAA